MLNIPNSSIAIRNPVISPNDGDYTQVAANPLADLISRLWQTAVILGAILLILYFIWGALEWLTAGGNAEQVKHAQGRITNAVIGLVILVASFAIILFLQFLFGFNLLNISWPTP